MCGIIGFITTGANKFPVNEKVLNQFENQKSRGMEGFGIVKITENGEFKVDRATEGYKFMWDIHQDPSPGILVHHRNPTSTKNKLEQTHPILVSNATFKHDYLVVHNGIIYNDSNLYDIHEKLDIAYTTREEVNETTFKFNDSESFAIELVRFVEGHTKEINIRGSVAFIALQINKKEQKIENILFGRNKNPLKMAKTRGKLFLSSEGVGNEILEDMLYTCKLNEELSMKKQAVVFVKPVEKTAIGFRDPFRTSWKENWQKTSSHSADEYGRLGNKDDLVPDNDEKEYNDWWKSHKTKSGILIPAKSSAITEEEEKYIVKRKEILEDEEDETYADMLESNQKHIIEFIEEFFTELDFCGKEPEAVDLEYYISGVRECMNHAYEEVKEMAINNMSKK